MTIQGFEKYQYFALLYDTVPVRAMLARNGSTTDCTSTAKWSTANTDVAVHVSFPIIPFPMHSIYGKSVGTTDLTAECDGVKGTQSITFDRYRIEGSVVDDTGAPVLGFHLINPYDFEGEYAQPPGRFVIGRVTKQRVPLTFYKAGYDSQIFNLDWDFTPTTRPIVTLRRVGVPLVDEMIRGPGKEYGVSIATHSVLRVEAEVFPDSYYGGNLISEIFDGDPLVASKTFVRDSALPKLQRLIEIPLAKGPYRLRFRDLNAWQARIAVTRIDGAILF